MKLGDRVLKFKTSERYTYRALSEMLGEPFALVYELATGKLRRVEPDIAIKLDSFLKERGY